MPVTMSDTEKREQLAKLIAHFDTAMLVTKMSDGRLRSRPLSVAAHDGTAELLFSTAIDSPKVGELEHDAHVNVVMQQKRCFVSITGRARISRDRALIERFWSESWKVRFPGGKDDPSLALVVGRAAHHQDSRRYSEDVSQRSQEDRDRRSGGRRWNADSAILGPLFCRG